MYPDYMFFLSIQCTFFLMNLSDSKSLKTYFYLFLLLQTWKSVCSSTKFTSKASKLAVADYFIFKCMLYQDFHKNMGT